jgi:outer membrane protein assembly factor BamB
VLKKNLYLTDAEGIVMALDKDSGSTVWKNDDLSLRNTTAPYAMDEAVIVGDFEGYLHALSRTDGHFLARIKLDGGPIDTRPVELEGGLLLQTREGKVYSLSLH